MIPRALAHLAGGESEIDVEARDVRSLLRALEERHPGLAAEVEERMAVAIDGEIHPEPWLEPLEPESEVHLLPRIQGGR